MMFERKNQIRIIATFDVGESIDQDLLLESVEAACGDMLYDRDVEDQRLNWGDFVRFSGAVVHGTSKEISLSFKDMS